MLKTRILGLHGPMGSGKSTVARELSLLCHSENMDTMTISFASPLKRMMESLLSSAGYSPAEVHRLVYTQEGKKESLDVLQGKTMRWAQQTLGTEWGRNLIGTNLWTDLGIQLTTKNPGVRLFIFDDVRFPSEQYAIEQEGGIVLKLVRDAVIAIPSHESEQVLDCDSVKNHEDDPFRTAKDIWQLLLDNET